jgi:hypothetical protein
MLFGGDANSNPKGFEHVDVTNRPLKYIAGLMLVSFQWQCIDSFMVQHLIPNLAILPKSVCVTFVRNLIRVSVEVVGDPYRTISNNHLGERLTKG